MVCIRKIHHSWCGGTHRCRHTHVVGGVVGSIGINSSPCTRPSSIVPNFISNILKRNVAIDEHNITTRKWHEDTIVTSEVERVGTGLGPPRGNITIGGALHHIRVRSVGSSRIYGAISTFGNRHGILSFSKGGYTIATIGTCVHWRRTFEKCVAVCGIETIIKDIIGSGVDSSNMDIVTGVTGSPSVIPDLNLNTNSF